MTPTGDRRPGTPHARVPGRSGTRVIRKIFNNNIVSAVDTAGVDVILVGAGVGYATGRGHAVDEDRVEREFHLTGHARNGAFRVLLEIPFGVLQAVSRVTRFLADSYGFRMPPSAEVALADHVAQALKRAEAGVPVANPTLWDTKTTYPAEFAVALRVLELLHEELGRKLPLTMVVAYRNRQNRRKTERADYSAMLPVSDHWRLAC